MGYFLNPKSVFLSYNKIRKSPYYVDKSMILSDLDSLVGDAKCYVCVTRPRRFGKTTTAQMIATYYDQTANSHQYFDSLSISSTPGYNLHCGQYDVIYLSFNSEPSNCNSYREYISYFTDGLNEELRKKYPYVEVKNTAPLWDLLDNIFWATGKMFIFVIDEWDFIFKKDYANRSDVLKFQDFLMHLLKDRAYVGLAYMTGVCPISSQNSASALNMFSQHRTGVNDKYSTSFGFTESEVDDLYNRYLSLQKDPVISRSDLKDWYDGYPVGPDIRIYNPESLVEALRQNRLDSYWKQSGPAREIFDFVKNNVNAIRDTLVELIAGLPVTADIDQGIVLSQQYTTRDDILSAMVVHGLLSYSGNKIMIPNKELLLAFTNMLRQETSFGYIQRLASESASILDATLNLNASKVARIIQHCHDTEIPLLHYNHESDLTIIVALVYLRARDYYRVEREDKAGTGYVDFIFYPESPAYPDGIILELKVDSSADDAIEQIRKKRYVLRFSPKIGESPRYTGRVIGVGIAYDKATKLHSCKIEVLRNAL